MNFISTKNRVMGIRRLVKTDGIIIMLGYLFINSGILSKSKPLNDTILKEPDAVFLNTEHFAM